MSRETVRARLEAVTEGPWTQEMDDDGTPGCVIRMGVPNEYGGFDGTIYDEGGHDEHDAAFIANARQDIPALLAVADEVDGLMQTLSVIRVLDVFPGLLGRLHVIAEAMAALDALP